MTRRFEQDYSSLLGGVRQVVTVVQILCYFTEMMECFIEQPDVQSAFILLSVSCF